MKPVRVSTTGCAVNGRLPSLLWALICALVLVTCSDPDGPPVPDQKQAVAIFERLHRGIYGAFDAKTESDVYDALSQSVAGDLLDRIYLQIYQSLVAREYGGVVSRIISVTPLSVVPVAGGEQHEDGAPSFDIRASWEVNSIAEHEGHRHLRANQYDAVYRVAWLDQDWRIVRDRMLRQRRLGEAWQKVGAAAATAPGPAR